MIELAEALTLVETIATPMPARRQRLLEACGRRLVEPVTADVDSPPWDRAMMDGFAVREADFAGCVASPVELDVMVDLAAGDVTALALRPGSCARIMTGAPVPPGADAVVPVERAVDGTATTHAGGRVRLVEPTFRPGQHVARQATAFRSGTTVLPVGALLDAAATGLAAEAGATHVVAEPTVRVAILSTGSELVPCNERPGRGQTRNSNGPMLAAAVSLLGAEAIHLGIAADRPETIRAAIAQGLAADMLVLSGGVSAGDLDLVPGLLAAAGVERVFHKVRLKPGKPVWFGILRRPAAPATLVFGLPGNPASSLVCFDLFARPAIAILAGRPRPAWHLPRARAVLVSATKGDADRPVFLPCRLRRTAAILEAEPLPWTGSSDLVGLAAGAALPDTAPGLVALAAGTGRLAPGSEVDVVIRGEQPL
ncbi:MAG: molybdopterin molybdotransferase MoeA [Planctomycetes bacterium]|nr:molybdopterin molybdotransferase MoeA [Planctomycetota bacterium]